MQASYDRAERTTSELLRSSRFTTISGAPPRHRRRRGRVALTAAVAVTATLIAASPAPASTVGGSAYALKANVNVLLAPLSVGALPSVVLPPEGGGPYSSSLSSVNLLGLAPIGAANVTTTGNSGIGSAASSASLLDVSLAGLIEASAVRSACTATAAATTGSTSISELVVAGIPVSTVHLGPNTTIALPVGSVVLNEQRREAASITVTAVHVTLDAALLSADVVLGQTRCSVRATTAATRSPRSRRGGRTRRS